MKFLLRYVQKSVIARLGVAAFLLALLDMMGVAVIFPYLSVLTMETPQTGSRLVKEFYYGVGASSRQEFLIAVSVMVAIFFLIKFAITYVANRIKYHTNARVTTTLSDDLFSRLMRSDYSFLANSSVSEMAGIVNAETIHATLCLDSWVTIATEALFLSLILVMITAIDPRLTTLILVALGILTIILYFGVIRRSAHLGTVQSAIHLRQYRFLFSAVTAMKDIKVLGLERPIENEHRDMNTRYASAIASFYVYQTLPRAIFELLVMLGLVGTSTFVVLTNQNLESAAPIIGLLAVAALRVIPAYSRIINAYGTFNYYKKSLEVVRQMYEQLGAVQVQVRHEPRSFELALEIRNLYFSHGAKPVLAGVSLSLRKGRSVGIVGLSGSGKTTFLDVLAGLRRAESGQFLLDGIVIDPYETDSLRLLIGYVPQNATLIDDSIAFNISFDKKPDTKGLDQAIKAARIEEFIHSLPEGLNTMVGENGVRVSGGQKQRIGIARALYRDPQILIFDEATSSLDNVTEKELNAEIAALSRSKTLLIVAHRLTTVAKCDEIHVFDQGRVVGSGTHEFLLETCHAYRVLYQAKDTVEAFDQKEHVSAP